MHFQVPEYIPRNIILLIRTICVPWLTANSLSMCYQQNKLLKNGSFLISLCLIRGGESTTDMASHILSDLVSYFTLDEINIDNWVFKLFYKVSTILCMVGASIGVAQSYFGKPISCQFSTIDQELANDYCWMHGSAYIPPEYQVF